ncbi:hypothetical protein CW304_19275 [Bacillus sp. UFRGS-B20]|nr:hypothetical protein CW304_19275 [Bacillus sp. UFRGS-B20]
MFYILILFFRFHLSDFHGESTLLYIHLHIHDLFIVPSPFQIKIFFKIHYLIDSFAYITKSQGILSVSLGQLPCISLYNLKGRSVYTTGSFFFWL